MSGGACQENYLLILLRETDMLLRVRTARHDAARQEADITERDLMLSDAVVATRHNDNTGGLRERVLRAAADKWPATICDSAPGRGRFGKAMGAILDASRLGLKV